jgi:hypothetical protein
MTKADNTKGTVDVLYMSIVEYVSSITIAHKSDDISKNTLKSFIDPKYYPSDDD